MFFLSDWYILPAAFLFDFVLRDPLWLPHPVRLMGKSIERLEPVFRKKIRNERCSGFVFAVFLILTTYVLSVFIVFIAGSVSNVTGKLAEILLVYYTISAFSLNKEAKNVYFDLIHKGLESSKLTLSRIVGRDVNRLDREGVSRAAIETVAENFVDGVFAPLFFACIGGAPLAMAYRTTNTLDSMVGYKNEKYMLFGWGSAKIDDLMNIIPSRISVPVISIAAFLMGLSFRNTFKTGLKDGRKHSSPNSGYPEASFAGALGVSLGGPNYYGNRLVEKPWIGETFKSVAVDDIKKACNLLIMSSVVSVSVFMCICLILM